MAFGTLASNLKRSKYVASYALNAFLGRGVEQGSCQKYQEDRLRAIVKHAYNNVRLYRRKYDEAGIKPEDIITLDDIQRLPIITKDDVRKGFPDDILARNVNSRDCFVISTSGHTASPVRTYQSKTRFKLVPVILLIGLPIMPRLLEAWTGRRVGRRISVILPADEQYDLYLMARQILKLPALFRGFFQFLDASDDAENHLSALHKHRPGILGSDPITLKNIVAVAQQKNLPIPQIKLLVTGGVLIDSNTRKKLSQAFGADIIEHYGSEETGRIAMECRQHKGLHILCRSVLLEVLQNGKPAPPGVPGEVVVTNLWNMASPMIRYAGLGDSAILSKEKCPCGINLPLIGLIDGRIIDSFLLPNGRMIHPFTLTLALEHIPMIAHFQIIQESKDRVSALIVPERNSEAATAFGEHGQSRASILRNLREVLGSEINISIDVVDDIPRVPRIRGCPSPVISLVQKPK
jgi:phenylacetate-CoA ligase